MISAICPQWGLHDWPVQAAALAPMVQSGEISEVVVVEIRSQGELRAIRVAEATQAVLVFVETPDLVSVATAFNLGIEAARGDWILKLSGDILPVPGSARAMRAWLEAHPSAALIGGDYWFGEVPQPRYATRHVDQVLTVQRAGIALNQYGLMRRSLWDHVRYDESGPFARPGWGLEDNDLGCQIRAAGMSIWMVQEVSTPQGRQQLRYVHRGVHGSVDKLHREGVDTAAEREARRAYCAGKWGDHPLDGRPWDWEREDDYIGPGRYSLRAANELQRERYDQGVGMAAPVSIWGSYRREP